ncbi:MAG TPA: lipase maturation factor family protein [Polyangiaceae bacterium]|nr:lipase maturation factor family protein [Polyangiaceae bacterium]
MTAAADEDLSRFRTAWWQRLLSDRSTYELTRFAILRLVGFVYLVAFAVLAMQLDPLLGSKGLLPVARFLPFLHGRLGAAAYWHLPSLFWFGSSDSAMRAACWLGLALSAAVLAGVTNAIVQVALWAIYMSFVHVGQVFYGYGWETQLLETGLLAALLCPARSVRPFPATAAPKVVIWLFRWLVLRIMVGAALIKLRNDPCWRNLTCLDFFYETQPNPNPIAWWLHHAPHWFHAAGVLLNHFVELVVPWFALGFRRSRHAAGVLLVAFQLFLVVGGNLSFLNWLTIVPALACFDDTAFARLLPRSRRGGALERFAGLPTGRVHERVTRAYGIAVAVLSVAPIMNLLSCSQQMNNSFDPLDLVNTYGAFGDVDAQRYEVILEGTADDVPSEHSTWSEYELPCMPGDVKRRPCLISPYHYRLDWQMWFVGVDVPRGETMDDDPWLVHLVWQLLEGDASPKSLLAEDPFPRAPPRWIRAGIWLYRFSDSLADGAWWTRKRVAEFCPPVSLETPVLREYAQAYGWLKGE